MTTPIAVDADSLVRLMRWYYPPGVDKHDLCYPETPQARRLQALLDGMARDMGLVERLCVGLAPVPDDVLALGVTVPALRSWSDFVQKLKQEFPGCGVWNKTRPQSDPCYSCQIYLPGVDTTGPPPHDAVVCLLSLLAPVYTIYGYHGAPGDDYWTRFPPLPEPFQDHERRLATLIEAEFGFTRLDKDVLLTPIPDLVPWCSNLSLGEAKLIDCLLDTEHPDQ